jgi:NAD(P)-dependent dehydrogenase (short-subunit alcohol dehydrogenase family)
LVSDIVFANAGIAKYAPFGGITEELCDSIFNINVKGLFFTVQKALPLLTDGVIFAMLKILYRSCENTASDPFIFSNASSTVKLWDNEFLSDKKSDLHYKPEI